jgi:UDP-glucose 4-epimerase
LKPEFHPPRKGDILNSLADITAARTALVYDVKVTWEEGLARTLDFYRQQPS